MSQVLLDRVLAPLPPPFALLHRPEATGPQALDVLIGAVSMPGTLAEIPLRDRVSRSDQPHDVLAILPYRQLTERGFACVDDGSPLIAMTITDQSVLTMADVLEQLPDGPIEVADGHFDVPDDAYADSVRRVISEEIGTGVGANFVIKRSFVADISGHTARNALTFFRRLLEQETGAYWTFIVHTGTRTFVGATPERHLSLSHGTAVMNPISGTYRYPPTGPTLPDVMAFLADRKETDELFMVLDEELKMMARVCDMGGQVEGPYLREMARLAHTEYFIRGHSTRDPREILRETMFAPTVTGSPLESACRVIAQYEPLGRGYYSGVLALIGHDSAGGPALDSAILIRTADISDSGRLQIGVGATVVRHSDPDSEVAETRAKAAGLLAALGVDRPERLGQHVRVRAALARRNTSIARFWFADDATRTDPDPQLAGRRVLVVDAEDSFTSMLRHQLHSLGMSVIVRRFDEAYTFDGYDLVILGPGPGDPRQTRHPKIEHLRDAIGTLATTQRPFIAVCLSHQVLGGWLGLELIRRDAPNQGVQREIDLFGVHERVGFYNTFAAHSLEDKVDCDGVGVVEVSRDSDTGEVYALRGHHFASMQFHPESVLTQDGVRIVGTAIKDVLGSRRHWDHESHDSLVGS